MAKKLGEIRVVGFNQLTTAERQVGEVVAFAKASYYRITRIDEDSQLVYMERVRAPVEARTVDVARVY
jgi:hypothetical protein